MPRNTIDEIKKTVDSLEQVDLDKKIQLNEMLDELHQDLSAVKPDQAQNIAASAQKVVDPNDHAPDLLDKLHKSVGEFETEHPKLVDTVNRLCIMLSDIGI
jgi:ABC-type transporter Mla subunit MlaD